MVDAPATSEATPGCTMYGSSANLDHTLAAGDVSAASTNNIAANDDLGKCPIKTIPAETRNSIYELAFTFEDHHGRLSEDLDETEPPAKAILLTCRQFFHEAKHMYTAMARQFWSTGKFMVRMGALVEVEEELRDGRDWEEYWDKSYRTDVAPVSELAISHVQRLKMVYQHSDMDFEKGVWYQGPGAKYDSVYWAIVPEATWKRYSLKPNQYVERHVTSKKIRIGKGHFMKLKCSGQFKSQFQNFIGGLVEASLTRAKIQGMMRGA